MVGYNVKTKIKTKLGINIHSSNLFLFESRLGGLYTGDTMLFNAIPHPPDSIINMADWLLRNNTARANRV